MQEADMSQTAIEERVTRLEQLVKDKRSTVPR